MKVRLQGIESKITGYYNLLLISALLLYCIFKSKIMGYSIKVRLQGIKSKITGVLKVRLQGIKSKITKINFI